jgi:rhamnogalacturonan endolyase
MKRFLHAVFHLVLIFFLVYSATLSAARYMENLDRGVIAVRSGTSNYIGWRLFGTDPSGISFNVYRDSVKINSTPIANSTNYLDTSGSLSSTYTIVPVIGGVEQAATESFGVWAQQYLTIPLQVPAGVTTPDDVTCTYSPNDCSVGDLDGDGEYEIVVKWDPSNSQDNSNSGYTGNVYLDAYKLNGTFLWRIDLGINIRAGAHYTQFVVYDLDSDGRAEVACRTAPYTKDGLGNYVLMPGDTLTDYRNTSGYILSGPEYLTIFDGLTGRVIANTNFYPDRVSVSQWGDNYGNRVDRFLAGVAYLDGQRPSLIMARGYYGPKDSSYSARNEITAWNWRDGELTRIWWFKAGLRINNNINSNYIGQGNHNLSIGDVDGDGFDEIMYGACAIDHDGTGLYSTGLGHGDAMHFSDLDPSRPGLEVFQIHEGTGTPGASFRDAATGQILWQTDNADVGRGVSADIDAAYPGCESWGFGSLRNCAGEVISTSSPSSTNFVVWWDGDLLRELANSNVITKYGGGTLLTASGCSSNNGTKSTPCLSADILGDWREEVIWRTSDNTALRIYTTTTVTTNRIYTLMHDPQYRLAIAWQNVAYNQPPHPGFFLGDGMAAPPVPDIILTGTEWLYGDFTDDQIVNLEDLPYFMEFWLEDECSLTADLDLNYDCLINYVEFAAFAANWAGPDITPPAAPDGLSAVAGNGTVSLNWSDNSETDLAGYNVYRSQTSGSGYVLLNTSLLTASDYTDNDVTNGITYYYIVTAVDQQSNESVPSAEVSAAPNLVYTLTMQENEAGFIGVFNGTVDNNNAGFTGAGFANTNNAVDQYVEWSVYAPQAGTYDLQWRFANGTTADRPASVSVGGTVQLTNISFPGQGSNNWTTWVTTSLVSVNLAQGDNRIRLIAEASGGLANIDWMQVTGFSPAPGQ